MNTPVDQDSIEIMAVAEGDMSALGQLYLRHHQATHNFLRKRLGVGEDVDELHQQFWLDLPKAARSFDPNRGRGRAWLFGVLFKTQFGLIKRWTRRAQIEVHPPDAQELHGEPALRALSIEVWLEFCRVFPTLSERDRDTLLLAAEGLSDQECGEIVRCSRETFRQRLCAARRRLRDAMGGGLADV